MRSPRCVTLPVTTAPTPRARPAVRASRVRSNCTALVARAITVNEGTRDIWSIRLSVSPLPRYSLSESVVPFWNGRTASDVIGAAAALKRLHPMAASVRSSTTGNATSSAMRRAIGRRNGAASGGSEAGIAVSAAEPVPMASSVVTRSRVEPKRSSGRLARHRAMARSNGSASPGRIVASGTGSSRMMAVSVSTALARRKARRPASIS